MSPFAYAKMKHPLILFLILVFVSGCGPHVKNWDSIGNNIICFGDSITYGEGTPQGEDYPTYLSKLLKRDVINAGVGGDTTHGALARLEKDVLQKDPYIVIVELGGNDFLQKIPKEQTMKNLEEVILKIQENEAMVALCDISGGMGFPQYREDFRKLAKKTRSIFIPKILESVLTNPSLKYDHIHPNSKGYKKIAEQVYKVIRPYVY